ncbi:histidine kinase, partial [Bacteroides thetaiotaomicron]|nr:histidine kinase [Bacteroides thetaiotaomicron]
DAMLNQKETVVELSWWDLHKDNIYIGVILLGIVNWIIYRLKMK